MQLGQLLSSREPDDKLRLDGSFEHDIGALHHFIVHNPLSCSSKIFVEFAKRFPSATMFGFGRYKSLFIEGTRPDRCILVAHADTVWNADVSASTNVKFDTATGIISSNSKKTGIGADDRAGIAMIWQLASLGHSILITDGEESGMLASMYLATHHTREWEDIQDRHSFILQLDREGVKDFKTYDVGTPEFEAFFIEETGRELAPNKSFTDIVSLCTIIPGANIGIGYYKEHTVYEYVDTSEWLDTLTLLRSMLSKSLPSFKL